MNRIKEYIQNYFIGLIIIVAIIFIYQLAALGSVRQIFIENFLTNVEIIQKNGELIIRGDLNWHSLRNFIVLIVFSLYTIFFLLFIQLGRLQKVKNKEELEFKIQEAIGNKINGFNEYDLQHYPGINNIIVENLSEIEEYKKRLEKEVEENKEALAFLAHDLKTPLTSAIGYLQILEMEKDLSYETGRDYSMIALKNVRRLDGLIQQFFTMAKINMNSIQLNSIEFNIYNMISEVVESFYPKLLKREIEVDVDMDENLMVYGDAEYLSRVFINVLNNAVLYSCSKSRIFIVGQKDDSIASIKIKNKAQNIKSIDIEHLFHPFYRMEESRNLNTGGSGLGLSIAKEIVTKHRGVILAYKEYDYLVIQVDIKINC